MTTAKRDVHEGEGMSARPAPVVLDELPIEASPDGERSRHESVLPVPVGNRPNSGGWPKARDLEADGSLRQVLERGSADDTPVGDAAALRTLGEWALMGERAQRAIIVVPQALLEKIDRHRDELSRAEFVGFCIRSLLEQSEEAGHLQDQVMEEKPSTSARNGEGVQAVSRQAFEEFAREVKELQQLFVDFLLDYGLESLDRAPTEVQEQFKGQVAQLLES